MAGPIAAVGGPQAPGGGKPTHVKLVTARSPLKHVTVVLEEEENVAELKRKLEQAVGVPASDMKIRLGGYNQFVMIDTASNIRVGSCGLTKAVHLTPADASTLPESFK